MFVLLCVEIPNFQKRKEMIESLGKMYAVCIDTANVIKNIFKKEKYVLEDAQPDRIISPR